MDSCSQNTKQVLGVCIAPSGMFPYYLSPVWIFPLRDLTLASILFLVVFSSCLLLLPPSWTKTTRVILAASVNINIDALVSRGRFTQMYGAVVAAFGQILSCCRQPTRRHQNWEPPITAKSSARAFQLERLQV